jgi:hypothetical protein
MQASNPYSLYALTPDRERVRAIKVRLRNSVEGFQGMPEDDEAENE